MQHITIYNRAFHIHCLVIVQNAYLKKSQDSDSQRGWIVKIQPNSPRMPPIPQCQPLPRSIILKSFKDFKKSTIKLQEANLEQSLCMYTMRKGLLVPNVFLFRALQKTILNVVIMNTKDNWLNTAGNKRLSRMAF